MPDDPNKKMDELLKAYAEERRKAPELNLHPATRKMLQGEVARAIGSGPARRSWLDRFRSFWPQIAFGTSLCLILGIAVVSLRHQPPSPVAEQAAPEKNINVVDKSALAPALEPGQDASQEKKKDALGREEFEQLQQGELRPLKSEQQPSVPQLKQTKERFVLQEAQVPSPAPTTLQRDDASAAGIAAADARQKPAPAQPPQSPPQDLGLQDQRQSKPATVGDAYDYPKSVRSQTTSVDSEARSRAPRPAAPTAPAGPSALSSASSATAPAFSGNNARVLPASNVANRGLQIPSAEKLARANEMTNLGAALRLQFVQAAATTPIVNTVNAGAAGATAPTALFTSFQMEQFGQDIRFVENDGSVYYGIIDQPTNLPAQTQALADTVAERRVGERLDERLSEQKANAAAPATAAPPATAAALTNSTAFNFTAQGTNLTLGKAIVLTGQYFEKTNSPPAVDSLAVSQRTQTSGRSYQRPEPQHMIIGTAVIETTNQVPVRAVSRD